MRNGISSFIVIQILSFNFPQPMAEEMCKPKAMGFNENSKTMWEHGHSFYTFIKTLKPACMVWNAGTLGKVQVSCALWSGLHKVFSHLKWDSKSQRGVCSVQWALCLIHLRNIKEASN